MSITIKQGETGVTVAVTLSDANGGVDLSQASGLTFTARRRGASTNKFTVDLTADADQTTNPGLATFATEAAHVADPGIYRWEAKATFTGGIVRRFGNDGIPQILEVVPAVGV